MYFILSIMDVNQLYKFLKNVKTKIIIMSLFYICMSLAANKLNIECACRWNVI